MALLAMSGVALAFADIVNPGLSDFVPAALFIAAVLQFATAWGVAYLYRRDPDRATAHLAGTFAMLGVLSLLQALVVPFETRANGALNLSAGLSMWTHAAWMLCFAVNAIVHVDLRTRHRSPLPYETSDRYLRRTLIGMGTLALIAVAALCIGGNGLPSLTRDTDQGAFLRVGIASALFSLCLLATVLSLALGRRERVERAFSLMALAVTLDAGLTVLAGRRFTTSWYALWLIELIASSYVFATALRAIIDYRTAHPDQGAARQAQRLETLWRLAGQAFPDDETFLRALIDEGARTLRSETRFHGVIVSIDGLDLVVEHTFDGVISPDVPARGSRFVLDDTVVGEVLRRGRTTSWRDIRLEPRFSKSARLRNLAWRSVIGTQFDVGPTTYCICFVSASPAHADFDAADEAYVETLASLCGARLLHQAHVERLRYQTDHDALTGVLNRVSFRSQGYVVLRERRRIAVVVADLDFFREINDTLGHKAGDAVLVAVAKIFERAAAPGEILARLGGDSFAILIPDAGDRRGVERAIERFAAALDAPVSIGEHGASDVVKINASFGVAMSPKDGSDFEDLLARAEMAVYAAKEAGRGRWAFFDPRRQDISFRTHRLQQELLDAITRDELVIYFQPHIELGTGRVSGAEALIRWNHPERGLLPPREFIEFAERHGLASRIGDWVMRETVALSRRWRQADPSFRVWFNISPDELTDPRLLPRFQEVEGTLNGIGVEITETAAMGDINATIRAIRELHRFGILVALDDFGTGYSSLAQLKRLEVDVVKIDRAFTAGVPGDAHDVAIYEAVISIAQVYGFETVAEGVEVLTQVAFLTGIGCTHGQGYLYAHPMPAVAFDAWFAERTALAKIS